MSKILFLALIAATLNTKAQVAVKMVYFNPTGEQGFVFKKTITGELMYLSEWDKPFRSRIGLTYAWLRPRLDTFPTVGYLNDGSGTQAKPGWQVFHKYNMGFLFAGMDVQAFNKSNFILYPGLDILFGGINRDYDWSGVASRGSSTGGIVIAGIRLRLGVEYDFTDQAGVFIEAQSAGYITDEKLFFGHRDYGAGFKYLF